MVIKIVCSEINPYVYGQRAFQVVLLLKNIPANAGDTRITALIPGLGRSPGKGSSNPLQNSWLENPIGQRSLVGYSPWGHKESDATDLLDNDNKERLLASLE